MIPSDLKEKITQFKKNRSDYDEEYAQYHINQVPKKNPNLVYAETFFTLAELEKIGNALNTKPKPQIIKYEHTPYELYNTLENLCLYENFSEDKFFPDNNADEDFYPDSDMSDLQLFKKMYFDCIEKLLSYRIQIYGIDNKINDHDYYNVDNSDMFIFYCRKNNFEFEFIFRYDHLNSMFPDSLLTKTIT